MIFAVENNTYATYSHQNKRQATADIYLRGESFGIASYRVDGNDAKEVYKVAELSLKRAREGKGPTLIEFLTYRFRDHVGPSSDLEVGYRTKEEVDAWILKCPIEKIKNELFMQGDLTVSENEEFEKQLEKELVTAFTFARQSPFPAPSEIYSDIYARN